MDTQRRLSEAREAYRRGDWAAAYAAFGSAAAELPPPATDLVAWATCAYLLGHEDEFVTLLDRAHHGYLDHGERERAAYCASWLALNLAAAGAAAPASGWFARARRLLEGARDDVAERGYLHLAEAMGCVGRGDLDAAAACAETAVATGQRHGDDDLTALALHMLGRVELRRARFTTGLTLLDEAMAIVTSRTAMPLVVGIVYCSVIDACRGVFSLRRMHEWTAALERWCEGQAGLVAFHADCRVARAEMLVLRGAWPEAAAEAERAGQAGTVWSTPRVRAAAAYQVAEVHRLRGELGRAEAAYAAVARAGGEAQPGLALLRLARGDPAGAVRALAGRLADTADAAKRARFLPALVEAALAAREASVPRDGGAGVPDGEDLLTRARAAAEELDAAAEAIGTETLRAMADQASGAVALAAGDAAAAARHLRRAASAWLELGAVYPAARARVGLAAALGARGDDEGADRELAAAREAFESLGAEGDLARLRATGRGAAAPAGLTSRELEVLAGISGGESNRAIALRLGISVRTVDRHVSNVLDKLGVASRAEAAAFAARHGLA